MPCVYILIVHAVTLPAVERYHALSGRKLSPVHTSNNVEATFDFVERTKFQRKTCSTLLQFLATKSNVASTSLLMWTGL